MAKVNSKEFNLLNVRKAAKKDSEILRTIPNGAEVEIESVRNGMGKLATGGYVNMDFIEGYVEKPKAPVKKSEKPVAKED